MSNGNTQVSGGNIGVLGLLGVAFVILKLVGVIGWSWWWVLAPFWIPWAIIAVIAVIFGLSWLIHEVVTERRRNRRRF